MTGTSWFFKNTAGWHCCWVRPAQERQACFLHLQESSIKTWRYFPWVEKFPSCYVQPKYEASFWLCWGLRTLQDFEIFVQSPHCGFCITLRTGQREGDVQWAHAGRICTAKNLWLHQPTWLTCRRDDSAWDPRLLCQMPRGRYALWWVLSHFRPLIRENKWEQAFEEE